MIAYGQGHCAVCMAQIPRGRLMCSAHWRKVPPGLQGEVYGALRLWNSGRGDLRTLWAVQDRAVIAAGGEPINHDAN